MTSQLRMIGGRLINLKYMVCARVNPICYNFFSKKPNFWNVNIKYSIPNTRAEFFIIFGDKSTELMEENWIFYTEEEANKFFNDNFTYLDRNERLKFKNKMKPAVNQKVLEKFIETNKS